MGLILTKSYLFKRHLYIVIISCLLLIGVTPLAVVSILQSIYPAPTSNLEVPLLLNSGMVQARGAEFSVLLWSEDGTIPIDVMTQFPMPDWIWTQKDQQTNRGNIAATLTGKRVINQTEESLIYTWYTAMAPVLKKKGVQIYLDERIPEAIDISAYLTHTNALPSQWFLFGNLISIAGYNKNIDTNVTAGKDRINIQLLSRAQMTDGNTVLAIPALLKEF